MDLFFASEFCVSLSSKSLGCLFSIVVEFLDPYIHKDLFNLGISAHMCTCGLNVKFSVLFDACLPTNVDKESEVITLSLFASTDSQEALIFLEIYIYISIIVPLYVSNMYHHL